MIVTPVIWVRKKKKTAVSRKLNYCGVSGIWVKFCTNFFSLLGRMSLGEHQKLYLKSALSMLADFSRPVGTDNLSEKQVRSAWHDLIWQETH